MASSRQTRHCSRMLRRLREQIERERDESQLKKRGDAILKSREYSFCLYPRHHFETLLAVDS